MWPWKKKPVVADLLDPRTVTFTVEGHDVECLQPRNVRLRSGDSIKVKIERPVSNGPRMENIRMETRVVFVIPMEWA